MLSEALINEVYGVCRCASDGAALAAAMIAPPDLVLLDVRLPTPGAATLDGLRVADVLARDARTCGVPVVLITGVGVYEQGLWAEQLASRGERVLFKPFTLADMLATVAELLVVRHPGGTAAAAAQANAE